MENFTIRSYIHKDREAVVDLWRRCDLIVPHNDPYLDIKHKLQVNPEWFLIGEKDGTIVATCMVGYEGHRGWINYLAVSQVHRRCGIATRMMKRAEKILFRAGCPKINLQVRETNQEVLAFYQNIGYANDHVISLGKHLRTENEI